MFSTRHTHTSCNVRQVHTAGAASNHRTGIGYQIVWCWNQMKRSHKIVSVSVSSSSSSIHAQQAHQCDLVQSFYNSARARATTTKRTFRQQCHRLPMRSVCAMSYLFQTNQTIHQVIDLGEIKSTITKYSKSVRMVDIPHAALRIYAAQAQHIHTHIHTDTNTECDCCNNKIQKIHIMWMHGCRERAQSLFSNHMYIVHTKCRRVDLPPPPYSMCLVPFIEMKTILAETVRLQRSPAKLRRCFPLEHTHTQARHAFYASPIAPRLLPPAIAVAEELFCMQNDLRDNGRIDDDDGTVQTEWAERKIHRPQIVCKCWRTKQIWWKPVAV